MSSFIISKNVFQHYFKSIIKSLDRWDIKTVLHRQIYNVCKTTTIKESSVHNRGIFYFQQINRVSVVRRVVERNRKYFLFNFEL